MKKLGILTGGGDAPGLNAVIRAVVITAHHDFNCEVLGIRFGFDGFLQADGLLPLNVRIVEDILPKGGTILGAANRGNPFARRVTRDGQEVIEDVSDQVIAKIRKLNLDALIVVGGDGTLSIARDLFHKGVPTVGVPKTIDNDVGGTEVTFGFDTALNVAVEAIDRLRTTAESHQRVMLLELMGRDAGFIALHAGLSGGADIILIPEIPFSPQVVVEKVKGRLKEGQLDSIVVVSEGAKPVGGKQVYSRRGDELHIARLGGISHEIGAYLESECRTETRVTVLGHIQRGGTPTAFDRWLATEFGAESVRLAANGGFGRMVAYQAGKIVNLAFADALNQPKRVDLDGDAIRAARGLGISLGDET